MNLITIIQAWENNALPKDIRVLEAYKKEIDACENITFQTWRTTTNRKLACMLMNEQIQYAEISLDIQLAIASLNHRRFMETVINKTFTSKSTY